MFEQRTTLVMIGDSVTDVGRARPVACNRKEELGHGYPAMVDAMLTAWAPELTIKLINAGISGNTVRDLKARWEEDVMAHQPDYVSVMIGINDIWRQFDCPQIPECHVYYEEYIKTYEELMARTAGAVKQMFAISCCFLEPNLEEPMRAMADQYNAGVKELCQKYGVIYVDAQAAFDQILKCRHPMLMTWDRVHPQLGGHTVIARAFLQAAGYSL